MILYVLACVIVVSVLTQVPNISKLTNSSHNIMRNSNNKSNKAIREGEYQPFPLIDKEPLTKDTSIYTFQLPHENDVLGIEVGQHISIRCNIDEKTIVRSYTPISINQDCQGSFKLLVKSYPNGTISKWFNELAIGDVAYFTGPLGNYQYTRPNMVNEIGMIAGGTGISPMFQIMRAIYLNPMDKTKISLIFGASTPQELFLKDQIDLMVKDRPNQFKVQYIVEDTMDDEKWSGNIGQISKEIMEQTLINDPNNSTTDKIQLLLCGPPRMVSMTKRWALQMGYKKGERISKMEDQIFVF